MKYLFKKKNRPYFQDFQLLKDRTVFKNLDFVLKATGWNNIKKEKTNKIFIEKVHIND